jgi:hypothetical protein
MTGKVYVVQENNRIDYSDAERFGEILFLTADEIKPISGSLRNQTILASIRRQMEDFDPTKDRLILTGNPMVIGYAFHLALSKSQSIVVLQWDRFSGQYREFLFNP